MRNGVGRLEAHHTTSRQIAIRGAQLMWKLEKPYQGRGICGFRVVMAETAARTDGIVRWYPLFPTLMSYASEKILLGERCASWFE